MVEGSEQADARAPRACQARLLLSRAAAGSSALAHLIHLHSHLGGGAYCDVHFACKETEAQRSCDVPRHPATELGSILLGWIPKQMERGSRHMDHRPEKRGCPEQGSLVQ